MKRYSTKASILLWSSVLGVACTISNDADRCGGPYTWDPDLRSCVVSSTSTDDSANDNEPANKDASVPDLSDASVVHTAQNGLDGLGASCETDDDCTSLGSNAVCAGPQEGKYCSVTCDVSSDDCPDGYVCCATSIPDTEDFCMIKEEFETVGTLVCSG